LYGKKEYKVVRKGSGGTERGRGKKRGRLSVSFHDGENLNYDLPNYDNA
jgi:hypothetical protein